MIRPFRLILAGALTACAGPPDPPVIAADSAAGSAAAPPAADTLIRPAAPRHTYTVLDSAAADVDGDGALERIELGATVDLDSAGRPLWEDAHLWVVAVRDGGETYPLVQRFVPWGGAAFWAIAGDSTAPAAILVQSTARFGEHGGTRVEKFVYDRARGGYARTGVVEATGVAQYRGPPDMPALLPPTARAP